MEHSSTEAKEDKLTSRPEKTESASDHKEKRSASILKATGKTIGRGLGLDVLAKDSRRIRSRFPNLWADIFSGSWRKPDNEKTEVANAKKTSAVAFILTVMTVSMAIYWVILFQYERQSEVVRWMPLFALSTLIFAGTIQSSCYWYIASLQRKKAALKKTANQQRSDLRKERNRKPRHGGAA